MASISKLTDSLWLDDEELLTGDWTDELELSMLLDDEDDADDDEEEEEELDELLDGEWMF